jgi:hypothetical protein
MNEHVIGVSDFFFLRLADFPEATPIVKLDVVHGVVESCPERAAGENVRKPFSPCNSLLIEKIEKLNPYTCT